MEKKLRYIAFLTVILGVQFSSYGQTTSEYPPEPMMTTEGPSRVGCGEGGNSPPPPVGLCLPINDYLIPLFASGIFLGGFSLFRLDKKQEARISVQ